MTGMTGVKWCQETSIEWIWKNWLYCAVCLSLFNCGRSLEFCGFLRCSRDLVWWCNIVGAGPTPYYLKWLLWILVLPVGSNSARHAGESLLTFAFKQASIFATWGISELQNLNASPMHEERSSAVPWARKGVDNTQRLPTAIMNATAAGGKGSMIFISLFSSSCLCIRN